MGVSLEVSGDFERRGGDVRIAKFGLPDQAFTVRHQLPSGGFVALGVGGRAWVEASAKRSNPEGSNVEALPVPQALESMREAVREATAFCTPVRDGKRFELAKVVRMDPVRDFDEVAHVPELLDGLATVQRDGRWKTRRYADAEKNKAETLRVGPKAHGSTLYDKCAETKGQAPQGRLRYEARLHSDQLASEWARKNGVIMRQIGDVNSEKVGRLTVASFERAAFDREVQGRASLAAKVFGCELTRRQQVELWAFLTAPGVSEAMSKPTRLRYRKIAAELGVALVQAEAEEAAPVLVRLDFARGTEVLRVA